MVSHIWHCQLNQNLLSSKDICLARQCFGRNVLDKYFENYKNLKQSNKWIKTEKTQINYLQGTPHSQASILLNNLFVYLYCNCIFKLNTKLMHIPLLMVSWKQLLLISEEPLIYCQKFAGQLIFNYQPAKHFTISTLEIHLINDFT